MGKVRHEKVASLLQSSIAAYLEERKDRLEIDDLISVDAVFLANDLKLAQVWVSFSNPDEGEAKLEAVNGERRNLQSYLFKKMAMKRVPIIKFFLSDPKRHYDLEDIFDTLESHEADSESDQTDS